MATSPRRRPRSAGSTALFARVNPDNHTKAVAAADALGVSLAAYVDALLARDELDAHGRPTWWPADDISNDQGELPLQRVS